VYLFYNNLVFTEFGQNIKMFVVVLAFIYIYMVKCYKERLGLSSDSSGFFIIMVYTLLFGCLLAISSNDLVLMFLSFEIISISLYFVAASVSNSVFKSELL